MQAKHANNILRTCNLSLLTYKVHETNKQCLLATVLSELQQHYLTIITKHRTGSTDCTGSKLLQIRR